MKKRQIGLFGLVIGQAITMVAKDKKLRKEVETAPGFLQKAKILGSKRLETNKELIEDIAEKVETADWDKSVDSVKSNIEKDSAVVKDWWAEQEKKDREKEGKESVRKIINNVPTQKSLEETLQKYKQKISDRRDSI